MIKVIYNSYKLLIFIYFLENVRFYLIYFKSYIVIVHLWKRFSAVYWKPCVDWNVLKLSLIYCNENLTWRDYLMETCYFLFIYEVKCVKSWKIHQIIFNALVISEIVFEIVILTELNFIFKKYILLNFNLD